MKCLRYVVLSILTATTSAMPVSGEQLSTPKVYLTGDSTMARGGGGPGTNGWGEWLHYSLKIHVIKDALPDRPARSYTGEGHFASIAACLSPGDFVTIEFGHNDGGSPIPIDNGRSDCPGSGSETCTTSAGIVVQTFPTYMAEATTLMLSKGAKVIISSQTPNNPWEAGTFDYTPTRFVAYAKAVVKALASPNVAFVDHGQYVGNAFESLGNKTVNSFYPHDHVYTSPAGATVVEHAFMKALMCGKSALSD